MITNEQITTEKELIRVRFAEKLVNNQGQLELINKLSSKLDSMDNDTAIYFLEEVFDGHLIYRRRTRESRETTLHRQSFSVNADDSIEFQGDPSLVRKEVTFVAVNKKTRTINSKGELIMSKEVKTCCPNKVDALIANKLSTFEESDKEWLLTQTPERLESLEKLTPKEPEKKVEKKVEVNKTKEVNMDEYIRIDSIKTADDYINHAPKDIRDSLKAGMQLNADRRVALVQFILDNAEQDSWIKEDLEVLDSAMLERLRKQFKTPVSYVGQNAQTEITDNAVPPMKPGGLEVHEKEGKEDK